METRTPLEKYNAEIENLNELMDAGLLDQETFARGMDKAQATLDKAEKGKDQTFSPAKLLQAGTQEAASFVAKIQSQQRGGDQQQQMLTTQRLGNTFLDRIEQNTRGGSGLTVANFN